MKLYSIFILLFLIGTVAAYTAPSFDAVNLVLSTDYTAQTYDSVNLVLGEEVAIIVSVIINSPENITYNNSTILFNVTATSSFGIDTCVYSLDGASNITMTQESTSTYGNYIDFFNTTAANGFPSGITNNGTHIWISDTIDEEVYKYYINGTYTGEHFDTAGIGIFGLRGITTDGNNIWAVDNTFATVTKFTMDGAYISNFSLTSENGNPMGITNNVTHLFITDFVDLEVYIYLIDGTYTGNSFDTEVAANEPPAGITNDGTYFFITEDTNDRVYRFWMNGTYIDFFNTTVENSRPFGITNNGTHLFVNDLDGDAVYIYGIGVITSIDNYIDTNSSMTDGQHNVTFACNDTSSNINQTDYVYFVVSTVTDTCTYTSGSWDVDCSDNCSIDSNVNLGGNNLIFTNSGIFYLDADITNIDKRFLINGCEIQQTINSRFVYS